MRDRMAVSAYILKIVEKDPFLRRQMRADLLASKFGIFFHLTSHTI